MNKFNQIENQILHEVKILNEKLRVLYIEKDNYSEIDYQALYNRYHGAKDYLLMTLTSFDNPISNYEFDNLSSKDKILRKNGKK